MRSLAEELLNAAKGSSNSYAIKSVLPCIRKSNCLANHPRIIGRRTSSSVLPSLTGKGCIGLSFSSSIYVCLGGRRVCTGIQSICMYLRGCTINETVTKRAGSKKLTQVDGFLQSSWDAMAWRPWVVMTEFQIEKYSLFKSQMMCKV